MPTQPVLESGFPKQDASRLDLCFNGSSLYKVTLEFSLVRTSTNIQRSKIRKFSIISCRLFGERIRRNGQIPLAVHGELENTCELFFGIIMAKNKRQLFWVDSRKKISLLNPSVSRVKRTFRKNHESDGTSELPKPKKLFLPQHAHEHKTKQGFSISESFPNSKKWTKMT